VPDDVGHGYLSSRAADRPAHRELSVRLIGGQAWRCARERQPTEQDETRADDEQTQKEAIDRAREMLRREGGGELTIHDRHNKIRDSDTVPHGNDPNRPRDGR
jgi:hypothetical protein